MVDNPIVVGTVTLGRAEKNRAIKNTYMKIEILSNKNKPPALLLRGYKKVKNEVSYNLLA